MNPKSKRTKLNAAFKSFQRLPSLLPKNDARRASSKSADQPPTVAPPLASATPPPGTSGLQFLAE